MDLLADRTQDVTLDVESPQGKISDSVRRESDSHWVLSRRAAHLLDVFKLSKNCQPPWFDAMYNM